MILAAQRLCQRTGMVLAVPIPQEAAAEGQAVERAISQALAESSQRSIQGNEVRALVCSWQQQFPCNEAEVFRVTHVAGDAVPAGAHPGAHRRQEPGVEYQACEEQCCRGLSRGGGLGWLE